MVMLIVVPFAHWLPSGVNVYTDVPTTPVLIDDGFHEPLTPLFESVGRAGADAFWQSGCICVKLGPTSGLMVMLIEVPTAHWLPFGVNT